MKVTSSKHNYGDDGQPTEATKALGQCEICPNYSFTSKIEKSLFHQRQTKASKPEDNVCDVCGAEFTSQSCLNFLRSKEKHTARDLWEQTEKRENLKSKKMKNLDHKQMSSQPKNRKLDKPESRYRNKKHYRTSSDKRSIRIT